MQNPERPDFKDRYFLMLKKSQLRKVVDVLFTDSKMGGDWRLVLLMKNQPNRLF